jgi:glycosyltransferase involved in cell wall biosynthesis
VTEREVTVVIPTRNRVALLAVTLATVRAQFSVEPEIVIVDDGSDPGPAAALQELCDERTTVLRNETSRGVAAARNKGLQAASTRWVAFLDDDDLWTPGKLAEQLAAIQDAGSAWVYSGAVKFAVGPILWQVMPPPSPDDVQRRLADDNIIPAGASNALADRETALGLGGFDERLKHLSDWDMWLRLLSVDVPAVAPAIAVAYRLHPRSLSLNPSGMLRDLAVLDTRWRGLRSGRVLEAGPTHLWMAMSYLRAGDRPRAARSYLRAARTRPKAGMRGMLRTLHPAPPTPAHVPLGQETPHSRFKRIKHVEMPDEIRALLDRHATPKSPQR